MAEWFESKACFQSGKRSCRSLLAMEDRSMALRRICSGCLLTTLLITPLNGLIGVTPIKSRVITPVINSYYVP